MRCHRLFASIREPGSTRSPRTRHRGTAASFAVLLFAAGPPGARAQAGPAADPAPPSRLAPADAWEAAGTPDVVLTSWTTANGLPQSSVNDLTATPDGFLWLATFGGIARFDGLGFEVFDIARLPELGSNRWVSVTDAEGGVVLGSEAGDLVWFDGRDAIRRISVDRPRPASRGGLASDGHGGFWQASSRELRHWDGTRWRSWGPDEGVTGDFPALLVDRSGRPWLGQANGVSRLEEDRLRLVVPAVRTGGRPWGLDEDEAGRVWVASESGLWLLGPDEVARKVDLGPSCVPPVGNVSLGGGVAWILTDAGACRLEIDPDRPLHPIVSFVPSSTMNSRNWEAIHVDAAGNAWVGSSGSGLRRFAPGRVRRWTSEKGLPRFRSVNHVAGDGAGGLWVGMGCAGLLHIGPEGPTIASNGPRGLGGDCVRALLREPDGDLWVGLNGGLARIAAGAPPFRVSRAAGGDGLAGPVTELARDSAGRVWLASGTHLGVVGTDGRVRWVGREEGLTGSPFSALLAAPDGAVWAGGETVVHRIVLAPDGSVTVTSLTERDGVPPGGVRALRIDDRGRLWVGTYGGGLAVLGGDGPNGRLTTARGLFDNAVSELLEDEGGRLWILGNRGIAVVEPARVDSVLAGLRSRLEDVLLGQAAGVPEGNGGSPAATLDARGRAWFATIDGVVGVDTRAFPEDRMPIPVRVETIVAEDRETQPGDPWLITGDNGDVVFRFTAPSLPASGETRFRYRLVGYDTDWIDGGSERVARYTNVDAGNYRFEVIARNRDGVWGTEPATVAVRVEPYWWQRTWLRWLLGGTLLALAGLALLRRVRVVERRNLRLVNTIRERDEAEERARRHQREMEHIARVAAAGELATSIAHELNQPLMAIVSNAAASDQLLSNPDMGKDVVREALRDIMSESRRASDVIRSLRSFLQRRPAQQVPVRVESVIGDVLALLRGELQDAGVERRVEIAPDLPDVTGDEVQLQQVLLNLIMNAVEAMREHSPRAARRLVIEARPVEGGLEIEVRDTGPGLGGETARRMFDPFFTTKESGMGIGLAISRTLIEAHGGRIGATNHPEGGAALRVFLPAADAPAGASPVVEDAG